MSGRDEQLRCRGCGSVELVFGTYNDRTYPFDILCKSGEISVVPMRNGNELIPNKTLVMEVANDFYVRMTDDFSSFVWCCPKCNECYSHYSSLYKELCEVLRGFIE